MNEKEIKEFFFAYTIGVFEPNEQTLLFHHFLNQGKRNRLIWKFLKEGVNVNLKDNKGRIALHHAFVKYKTNIVKAIIERTLDLNVKDCTGRSPLYFAVRYGPPEGVELLLKEGATVNIVDNHGYTPLHYALDQKNTESAKILVDNGANLKLRNRRGRTALHIVMENENLSDDDKTCAVNLLLDKEANVNTQDNEGKTPLHLLLKCHRTSVTYELCALLLKKGANLLLRDNYGLTLLHVAIVSSAPNTIKRKDFELVKLLLDSGAEIDYKNNRERISHACRGSERDSLSPVLVEAALINAKTLNGMTPLHCAVDEGNKEIVELLLSKGADVNSKNETDETPIFYVSNMNILSILLQMGADVNVQDIKGRTFMHYVAFGVTLWNDECMGELLDWGASLSIKDNSGNTPVDMCKYCRYKKRLVKNANLKYLIRKACVNLPQNLSDHVVRSDFLISYQESCWVEVDEMKLTKFGNNFLYDIFRQWDDPKFLWNKELVSAVKSTELKVLFPIFDSLLKATYTKAKIRVELLNAAADILNLPLPREVTRNILAFVDDDSLLNVKNIRETIS